MMKKKLLFLLVPLLLAGLSGCVKYNGQPRSNNGVTPTPTSSNNPSPSSSGPSGDSSSVTPPNPAHGETSDDAKEGDKITIYLVFGQYGKYEGEFVNTNEESLFLEHVKKVQEAVVGSDLPGKDKVTSSAANSVFKAWVMYKNDGKLTEYTKVPAIKNAILYASFEQDGENQGGGGSQGGGSATSEYAPSSATETATSGFGFIFPGAHTTYMLAVDVGEDNGYHQYKLTKRSFTKNQEFKLYDFSTQGAWVVNVDQYSFGGSDTHPNEWQNYLSNDGSKYTVLKDFNVSEIYIKTKLGDDQVYFALA